MEQDEAMAMIVRGFIEPIAKELPMEYALELNRLIELQMEGAGRLTSAGSPVWKGSGPSRGRTTQPTPAPTGGAGPLPVVEQRAPASGCRDHDVNVKERTE
jgi:hypothetical protein